MTRTLVSTRKPGRSGSGSRTVGTRRLRWPARIVAALGGLAVTSALGGFFRILESIFGPSDLVRSVALSVVSTWAAIGPWAAHRAAAMVGRGWTGAAGAWARVRGKRPSVRQEQIARALMPWMLLSTIDVALGVLVLAGLPLSGSTAAAWRHLTERFLWTEATELICLLLLMSLVLAPIALAGGLQLVALYAGAIALQRIAAYVWPGPDLRVPLNSSSRRPRKSLSGPPAPASVRSIHEHGVTAAWLAGAAAGVAMLHLAAPRLSATQWVLLGAVFSFLVSAGGVVVMRRIERLPPRHGRARGGLGEEELEWSPARGSTRLVVAAALGWGAATAAWCSGWCARIAEAGPLAAVGIGGIFLAGLSTGAWLSLGLLRRTYSTGGYGMALLMAGLTTLAGTTWELAMGPHPGWARPTFATAVAALGLGYALPYGRRALAARVANPAHASARWLTATLAGAAAAFCARAALGGVPAREVVVLTTTSLVLLIFGGLLQVYDAESQRPLRRRRLAAVFAALGLALAVLPRAAERAMAASSWPSLAGPGPPPQAVREIVAALRLAPDGAAVAAIGAGFSIDPPLMGRVHLIPWACDDSVRHAPWHSGDPEQAAADAWWRRARGRYDLIIQTTGGLRPAERWNRWTHEWLVGLRRRMASHGAVLVEAPSGAADVWEPVLRAFTQAFAGCACYVVAGDRQWYWLLAIDRSPQGPPREISLAGGLAATVQPAPQMNGRMHTLRRPVLPKLW